MSLVILGPSENLLIGGLFWFVCALNAFNVCVYNAIIHCLNKNARQMNYYSIVEV